MREPQSGCVGVVDPAVAGPVLAGGDKTRWKITHILNTHHRGDHGGGSAEIKKATGCTIVGPRRDRAGIPEENRLRPARICRGLVEQGRVPCSAINAQHGDPADWPEIHPILDRPNLDPPRVYPFVLG